MSALPHPPISPEQYLEMERAAEAKSEYYRGSIYAMSGGSYAHAQVIGNLTGELRARLKGRSCSVTPSGMRVRTSAQGLYTYPDVVVVCGQPEFADDQRDTLLNPNLLIEVLSPSTERRDRGFKFAQYRSIESLGEYLLVSQEEAGVECFARQSSGQWLLAEFVGLDAVCQLQAVDCDLPLTEIYYGLDFGPEVGLG